MRTHDRCLRTLLLGVILVWGGGCLGGVSAPTRFYTLVPMAGPPTEAIPISAERGPAIGVGPVTLPGYLDRREIVTRRGRDEVELGEFDHWSEQLKDGATRVLGENLAILLRTERVVLLSRRGSHPVRYQVAVDVARFEGAVGAAVTLEARWRILGGDGKELALRRSTVTEVVGAPGYGALVAAMSRALGALSQDIATAIRDLP
ncbi:MAG: membrane integrity-associated transporter subunit PqiC [Zetaproteobacteria bacterium]|nr:MAG: membrane integrity-associated transporter subunit PqiC [Zetaproteobacteria bacterium]